jgi:hypothetical protein
LRPPLVISCWARQLNQSQSPERETHRTVRRWIVERAIALISAPIDNRNGQEKNICAGGNTKGSSATLLMELKNEFEHQYARKLQGKRLILKPSDDAW